MVVLTFHSQSMKKYFLLITLFAIIFLWLGNYTHALTCSQQDTDWIDSTNANCPNWYVLESQNDEWNPCCNPEPSWVSWALCAPPSWWHLNALTICVCDDGYKNVDGVCKPCSDEWVCCGIELNTSVPFIGKCIESKSTDQGTDETNVTWETAFPVLMWSLTKILVTAILILSFVLIVIGGIMIATGDASGGKKMIIKVVVGIAILGASGVILRLINPNFFG
jgi:hypothetical protein